MAIKIDEYHRGLTGGPWLASAAKRRVSVAMRDRTAS
jgi:hypothetical protein